LIIVVNIVEVTGVFVTALYCKNTQYCISPVYNAGSVCAANAAQ